MSSKFLHPNIEKGEAIKARNFGFWNSLAHIKEQGRVPIFQRFIGVPIGPSLLYLIITYFLLKVKPIGPAFKKGFFYYYNIIFNICQIKIVYA